MMQWISVRGPGGLRFGQSIGPEDLGPPKLLSWRRYELRKQLQTAATAKGKTMTVAACDYVIDRVAFLCGFRCIFGRFGVISFIAVWPVSREPRNAASRRRAVSSGV
jgi:hypothetical protein